MTDRRLVMSRIKGFSLGVLVVVCWLLFATVYSAFKHSVGRKQEDYEVEFMQESVVGKQEVLYKMELVDLQGLESFGDVKTIDDRDQLIKDARRAAQVTQDLCVELNMEKCL